MARKFRPKFKPGKRWIVILKDLTPEQQRASYMRQLRQIIEDAEGTPAAPESSEDQAPTSSAHPRRRRVCRKK